MPDQRQTILAPNVPTPKSKGTRKEDNIRASFPSSPIHNGELTDEERKKAFQELVMTGIVLNGKGLNSYNRDFTGTSQNPVPDMSDVITGGGGLPASPYMPNPTSPGPGSINAADQLEYNGEIPNSENNIEFGSGMGGLVSPHETSKKIAEHSVLGSYISGRSYKGSDGKA